MDSAHYVPWEWARLSFRFSRHTFVVQGYAANLEILKDVAKELAYQCLRYKKRMMCSHGDGGVIFVTKQPPIRKPQEQI